MIALRWFIALFVISASLVGLFGYKSALNVAKANQSMGEPAATIEAMHVVRSPYQQTTTVIGVSRSAQVVTLANELGGKINKINFTSGDLVRKGQVLIEQDHSEESAKLIATSAKLVYQQKILDRYRVLRRDGRISEEVLDKSVMDLKISESGVAVLEARIRKKVIRVPFDARAGIHDFQIGQYLEENSSITSLVGVNDHAWIDFYVPQTYDELALGEVVNITITGQSQHEIKAVVVSVEPMLSDDSRQYKYRARLDNNKAPPLKHNYLVKVTLPVKAPSQEISIPALAVSKDQLGDYVFKVNSDESGVQRVHRHKVELNGRIGDHVIVSHGLEEGDYIASTGVFKLRPGLKVFISEAHASEDAELTEGVTEESL